MSSDEHTDGPVPEALVLQDRLSEGGSQENNTVLDSDN